MSSILKEFEEIFMYSKYRNMNATNTSIILTLNSNPLIYKIATLATQQKTPKSTSLELSALFQRESKVRLGNTIKNSTVKTSIVLFNSILFRKFLTNFILLLKVLKLNLNWGLY